MKKILNFIPASIVVLASLFPGSAISYTTVNTPSQPSSNNSALLPKPADKSETNLKAKDSKANNVATQKSGSNEMKDPKK